jgi:hypothetical protein
MDHATSLILDYVCHICSTVIPDMQLNPSRSFRKRKIYGAGAVELVRYTSNSRNPTSNNFNVTGYSFDPGIKNRKNRGVRVL